MCTKLHDERDAMRQAIVYPANTDVFPSCAAKLWPRVGA
jgi:hypothetical protein